jgi:uncharacterized protein (DUF2345 family)
MKENSPINQGLQGQQTLTVSLGIVRDNADPAQEGRLKVYVPSVDSSYYELDDLPWAKYVTPFGGTTADFLVGREKTKVPGMSSYGFWAIPKNNAQVLVGFLDGNPQLRVWLGCLYIPELMRTMPQSINPIKTEIDESGNYPQQTIPHYEKNLGEAGLDEESDHWKSRGGYERSISHPSNKNKDKPTDDGYWKKPLEEDKADSQAICLTSPGRHYLLMSDVDEHCRVRLKTTEGSQILLDDTNERIYISTAKGRNWVELDETNGKIYIYSDSKINIRAKNDINLYSDENINIAAKKRVNIQSEEAGVKIQAKNCIDIDSSAADIKLTASRDLHLKTLDGDIAEALDETTECILPTKHHVRQWAEDGGSETSKIRIQAAQGVEMLTDQEGINVTANTSINLKTIEESVSIQSATSILLKAEEDIRSESNSTISFLSNYLISEANSISSKSTEETISQASGFSVKSSKKIIMEASEQLSLKSSDILASVTAPEISGLSVTGTKVSATNNGLSSSTASSAEAVEEIDPAEEAIAVIEEVVSENMIKPDHESWERDEDEQECETPRNDNWNP